MKTIHEKTSLLPGMREARSKSGKTMPELGLETRYSVSHLYKVEYCGVGASGGLASSIADALGVTTDFLYGRTSEEKAVS